MHIGLISIESPKTQTRIGGLASYIKAIMYALVEAGHRVTVIAHHCNSETLLECQGRLKIVHVPLPCLHWYLYKLPFLGEPFSMPFRELEWSWALSRVALKVFNDDPVDVIESTEIGSLFLDENKLAPWIIRLHGNEYIFRKYSGQKLHFGLKIDNYFEKILLQHANAVTSPSLFQARDISNDLKIPMDKITIIPNPISSAMLEEGLKVSIEDRIRRVQAPMVLNTARIEIRKGTIPLMKSVPMVSDLFPDVQYVLTGDWMDIREREFESLLNIHHNRRHVTRTGHVPQNKLRDLYSQATVFVMPSYYESFGISAIEAMAWGLPVVAANGGGLAEVVENGVTGIVIPTGDEKALGEAVIRLLKDPDLRFKMGQAGRERVLKMYLPQIVARQTIELYEKTIQAYKNRKRAFNAANF